MKENNEKKQNKVIKGFKTSWKKKEELFNKCVNELPKNAIKINLGSGGISIDGFINADCYGNNYNINCDLNVKPYPFKDNSIDFILCDHVLEHVREQELFWEEIYRILKPRGKIFIGVPHCTNKKGAYCTFGHRGFYHEDCINSITTNNNNDSSVSNNFNLIEKIVARGRFLKWQKREILWIVEKKV
ncbi:MAG: class I SAM-dependent methyltransferase [Nanoarchaeota archaeon]